MKLDFTVEIFVRITMVRTFITQLAEPSFTTQVATKSSEALNIYGSCGHGENKFQDMQKAGEGV